MAKTFTEFQSEELEMARRSNPKPFTGMHQGWAIIYEEVDELWDELRKKDNKRDPVQVLTELIQIAAMAQRMAEDLNLVEKSNGIHNQSDKCGHTSAPASYKCGQCGKVVDTIYTGNLCINCTPF